MHLVQHALPSKDVREHLLELFLTPAGKLNVVQVSVAEQLLDALNSIPLGGQGRRKGTPTIANCVRRSCPKLAQHQISYGSTLLRRDHFLTAADEDRTCSRRHSL
jgi:hypothetical protein